MIQGDYGTVLKAEPLIIKALDQQMKERFGSLRDYATNAEEEDRDIHRIVPIQVDDPL